MTKKNPCPNPDKTLPYSTVLEVKCDSLVIICGQVAEDEYDNIVGTTIEEQTHQTLENCKKELAKAGCTLESVFKVNIYIKNIEDWSKLNSVYNSFFNLEPKPVRTTVQAGLLDGLLVEIELWAAK